MWRNENEKERRFCVSHMVSCSLSQWLTRSCRNINVFGLAFIIAFSTSITLVNLVLLKFLVFLSRFRQALAPRLDRWVQDGVFQLQRRAFEAHGEGVWMDLEKEIPITTRKEMLRELPISSLSPSQNFEINTHSNPANAPFSRQATFVETAEDEKEKKEFFTSPVSRGTTFADLEPMCTGGSEHTLRQDDIEGLPSRGLDSSGKEDDEEFIIQGTRWMDERRS